MLCLRLNGTNLLISGAADASIVIWNAENGEKLHTLRGRTRGVLDLAVDPTTYPPSPLAAQEGTTFFSAGSDKEIRRWRITSDVSSVSEIETEKPILQHETSVYKLQFDVDDDLWTASADGTVKCLSRERGWEADTVLVHGDYIRAVVIDERGGWIASAGRDEDIKIWDRGSGKLHHTFSGHFEEITGMVLVGQTVVTVSIDATVRQWSLKPEDLRKAVKKAEEASNRVEEEAEEKVDVAEKKVLMTADEERELAELMSSDSD